MSIANRKLRGVHDDLPHWFKVNRALLQRVGRGEASPLFRRARDPYDPSSLSELLQIPISELAPGYIKREDVVALTISGIKTLADIVAKSRNEFLAAHEILSRDPE